VPALGDALAATVSDAHMEHVVLLWMVLGTIGYLLVLPLRRRVGGIDPRTGRPGGSEMAIVGVTWFIAALVTGIYLSTR
jgi:hypothetical protein